MFTLPRLFLALILLTSGPAFADATRINLFQTAEQPPSSALVLFSFDATPAAPPAVPLPSLVFDFDATATKPTQQITQQNAGKLAAKPDPAPDPKPDNAKPGPVKQEPTVSAPTPTATTAVPQCRNGQCYSAPRYQIIRRTRRR